MGDIQHKLSDKFRSHWIKVKFYEKDPKYAEAARLKGVRFCEAVQKALFKPVLLDRDSICCHGAQYAFGWNDKFDQEDVDECIDKRMLNKDILKSLMSQVSRLEKPVQYIGLNMPGEADLVISFLPAEQVMMLINRYHNVFGRKLDLSISSMMSICGGVAVQTFLNKDLNISFGCKDSRKYADIRRENLAVGIPTEIASKLVN